MPIDSFILVYERERRIWAPENPEDRANVDSGQLITCPYTTHAATGEDTANRASVDQLIRGLVGYQPSPDTYCGQVCSLDCPAKNEF
jgi:hypothetical protein